VTQVIAHRGASADAPENTLAAVELALAQGADRVEVDVQRTADGVLVLVHDADLRRTTDVGPARAGDPVGAFTLAELRRLDAGSWFAPRFAGERIPTLDELLDLVRGRAGVHLELKDPARYPGVERQVVAALRPGDDVLVQSFDHACVRRVHALAPDVPLGLLVEEPLDPAALRAAAGFATEVNPDLAVVDQSVVDAAHAHGLAVSVWTVDDVADLRRTRDLGVDAIITDVPAVLAALLAEAP
jgi:glycerophosphoryl diester phosphodiesterase